MSHLQRNELVLIGPVCAGKSTVAELLAARHGVPHVDLDSIIRPYFESSPHFDAGVYNQLAADDGFTAAYRYSEPTLAYALEHALRDHHDCIFDVGAGYTSFLDEGLHDRAATALRPFATVVLIVPSAREAESVAILRDRCRTARDMDWIVDGVDFIEHWVISDQNRRLATMIVHTEADPPSIVADRVNRVMQPGPLAVR